MTIFGFRFDAMAFTLYHRLESLRHIFTNEMIYRVNLFSLTIFKHWLGSEVHGMAIHSKCCINEDKQLIHSI